MAERLQSISIKIEVVDTDCEHSWNVQGLCSACLCARRATRVLTDAALMRYYEDILTDNQYQCGTSPRLCWECVSVLRRAMSFREQVKQSHDTLHSVMHTCDMEKIDNNLIVHVSEPSRLQTGFGDSVDIWPECVMNPDDTTDDHRHEDAAADNNSQRHADFAAANEVFRHEASVIDDLRDETYAAAAAINDEFRHEQYPAAENDRYHQENYADADNGGYRDDEFNAGADDDMNNDDDDCGQLMEPLVQIKEEDVSDHDALDPADALECELREEPYSADYVNEDYEGTSGIVPRNNITTLDEKTIMTLTLLKCDRCDYTTISAQALERHSHLHDTNRPYQCEICHKGFNRSDGLKRHMTTHTRAKHQYDESRIYECKVCKKKLTRKTHLKDHMRTHTGEKPFLCSICKRGFSSTCDLTRHWRTHTKEKPYQCSVCQKGFTSSGDWKKHMRIHTGERPYQCTICEKGCTNSNGLKLHMRTHTGEKPYECTVCKKRFTSTSDLARHGKTHTKEKPYECTICHKHFSRSGGLKVHMSKHVPSTTIAVT